MKMSEMSDVDEVHHLFRKGICEALQKAPHERHLCLKVFPKKEKVLGIVLGVNFLHDKEILSKRQLVAAVQKLIPSLHPLEDSFFACKRGAENICTLYLEFVKPDAGSLTKEEMLLLRTELPQDVKQRVENLFPAVFMPRNDEEIMRMILSLSSQIRYLRDIPQVSMTFDEQTSASLYFTVIVVRVMKPGMPPLQELFKDSRTSLEYIPDQSRAVGDVRKKYSKEATVFRLKLPKEQFLRRDQSVDLVKARQAICAELMRIIGEFRDYNGGMISKQGEKLAEIKKLIGKKGKYDELLLENFFYSLNPFVMRTMLEPEVLQNAFKLLSQLVGQGGKNVLAKCTKDFAYIVIRCQQRNTLQEINRMLNKFHLHSSELAIGTVTQNEMQYLNYIYRCDHPYKQQQFCRAISRIRKKQDMQDCNKRHQG